MRCLLVVVVAVLAVSDAQFDSNSVPDSPNPHGAGPSDTPHNAPPVGGNVPLVGGNAPPFDGNAPPVGGNAPPVGGNTPPFGGNAPPVGGNAPPVGGKATTPRFGAGPAVTEDPLLLVTAGGSLNQPGLGDVDRVGAPASDASSPIGGSQSRPSNPQLSTNTNVGINDARFNPANTPKGASQLGTPNQPRLGDSTHVGASATDLSTGSSNVGSQTVNNATTQSTNNLGHKSTESGERNGLTGASPTLVSSATTNNNNTQSTTSSNTTHASFTNGAGVSTTVESPATNNLDFVSPLRNGSADTTLEAFSTTPSFARDDQPSSKINGAIGAVTTRPGTPNNDLLAASNATSVQFAGSVQTTTSSPNFGSVDVTTEDPDTTTPDAIDTIIDENDDVQVVTSQPVPGDNNGVETSQPPRSQFGAGTTNTSTGASPPSASTNNSATGVGPTTTGFGSLESQTTGFRGGEPSTGFGSQGGVGFGSQTTPTFGAQPQTQPKQQNTTEFGGQRPVDFGGQTTPGFGSSTNNGFRSQDGTEFGRQSTPSFGAQTTSGPRSQGAVGFGSPTTAAFGAQPTTAFGNPSVNGLSSQGGAPFGSQTTTGFGGVPSTNQTGTNTFGGQSTVGFGSPTTVAFGVQGVNGVNGQTSPSPFGTQTSTDNKVGQQSSSSGNGVPCTKVDGAELVLNTLLHLQVCVYAYRYTYPNIPVLQANGQPQLGDYVPKVLEKLADICVTCKKEAVASPAAGEALAKYICQDSNEGKCQSSTNSAVTTPAPGQTEVGVDACVMNSMAHYSVHIARVPLPVNSYSTDSSFYNNRVACRQSPHCP
jgi:hypothetical protein